MKCLSRGHTASTTSRARFTIWQSGGPNHWTHSNARSLPPWSGDGGGENTLHVPYNLGVQAPPLPLQAFASNPAKVSQAFDGLPS